MAVYVDKVFTPFGRYVFCHMLADSVQELHAMADKIGCKREWYQDVTAPHYDISRIKRELAIQNGAIEASRAKIAELVLFYRRQKAQSATLRHTYE